MGEVVVQAPQNNSHSDDICTLRDAVLRISDTLHIPVLLQESGEPSEDVLSVPVYSTSGIIAYLTIIKSDKNQEQIKTLELYSDYISRLLKSEEQLRHRLEELTAVYEVTSALTGMGDIEVLLNTALKIVINVVGVDAGVIRLFDEDSDELVVKSWYNLSDSYFDKGPVLVGDSELDKRALAGEIVYVEDLSQDKRVRYPDLINSENLHSFLCTGLVSNDTPVGVIRLYTRYIRRFNKYEYRLLQAAAQQVATAIVNRTLLDQQRDARIVQRQIELASSVQRRMLPQKIPALKDIYIAAHSLPSLELGGDFYDFIDLNKSRIMLVIGDVVGKGIPAALHMASVRATLRAHALNQYPLDTVLKLTNRAMVRDTKYHEFATVWCGIINTDSKILTYSNAGHEPAMICRKISEAQIPESGEQYTDAVSFEGYVFYELRAGGMVVGVDSSQTYDKSDFQLSKGDVLIAFSDGLSEAMNFDKEMFGKQRIKKAIIDVLRTNPKPTASDIMNHVLWEARRFVGFNVQSDDITLFVVYID